MTFSKKKCPHFYYQQQNLAISTASLIYVSGSGYDHNTNVFMAGILLTTKGKWLLFSKDTFHLIISCPFLKKFIELSTLLVNTVTGHLSIHLENPVCLVTNQHYTPVFFPDYWKNIPQTRKNNIKAVRRELVLNVLIVYN